MKTKLNPTQNDLRDKIRRATIDLLNQQLADVLDLGLQAKQAHWNVKGPHFIGLHELFDKVAECHGSNQYHPPWVEIRPLKITHLVERLYRYLCFGFQD